MSLINREDLMAEYDRVHVGPAGGARKLMEDAEPVEAIPISYINSRISRLRQYKTYAGDFAGDLLEAIIKDYNKEAHNEQTE